MKFPVASNASTLAPAVLAAVFAVVLGQQAQAQFGQGSAAYGQQVQENRQSQQNPSNQNLSNEDVQAQLEAQARGAKAAIAQAEPSIAPAPSGGNPIYILNNQRVQGYQGASQQATHGQVQGQAAIQEQPVTVVQESPLKASQADLIRKRRQDVESQTEDGMVQALEKARIEDEIRRRERLTNVIAPVGQQATQQSAQQSNGTSVVGDNNTVQQTNVVQQPQQVQQVLPVQVVPVAPVAPPVVEPVKKITIVQKDVVDEDVVVIEKAPVKEIKEEKHEEKAEIRNEIRAAVEDTAKKLDLDRPFYYISALASFGNYDNVINVDRSLGYGFAAGVVTSQHWVVEGSFLYGNYQLLNVYNGGPCCAGGGIGGIGGVGGIGGLGAPGLYPPVPYQPILVDMRQYNFAGALKYQLPFGKFRPSAGGLLSYTRRNYSYDNFGSFRATDSIDAGLVAGADLILTWNFSIGIDFRYYTNVAYRSANLNDAFVYQLRRNSPEQLDYYTVNLLGKLTF